MYAFRRPRQLATDSVFITEHRRVIVEPVSDVAWGYDVSLWIPPELTLLAVCIRGGDDGEATRWAMMKAMAFLLLWRSLLTLSNVLRL